MRVLRTDPAPLEPDCDKRSDLINPSVLLCLTLDHPFACCSSTSTLVPGDSVLTMLLVVDGPDLRFTVPFVLSDDDDVFAAPDDDNKSVRIKPSVPLCLTLDHPFAWFSSTSTLVPVESVLNILSSVDAPALKLTDPVVLRVPIADDVDAAATAVVCAALPSPPRVRKSDLI